MTLNLSIPDQINDIKPKITVIGIGGAGGNAVNTMINANVSNIEFITANTDGQALSRSLTPRQIQLGKVGIGSDFPVTVQSMTTTKTRDTEKTLEQVYELANNGADIVRVTCNEVEAAESLVKICARSPVPIVADIDFQYKLALAAVKAGVQGLRLNPVNIRNEKHIKEVAVACLDAGIPIRIGVNAGSLDQKILEKYKEPCPEALVESAQYNIKLFEDEDFHNFKISVKSSDVMLAIKAYELLSESCNYPLHLGITEAGSKYPGSIKSSIGIGYLLMKGIGDTIRVSLSADPIEEIKAGYEILKSLNIRSRGVKIISCPSCARQAFQVIDTVKILEEKLSHIKTPITLSIIGCVVNGPGEASLTDIGITGGGKGNNMLYLSGVQSEKVLTNEIINKVISEVEKICLASCSSSRDLSPAKASIIPSNSPSFNFCMRVSMLPLIFLTKIFLFINCNCKFLRLELDPIMAASNCLILLNFKLTKASLGSFLSI